MLPSACYKFWENLCIPRFRTAHNSYPTIHNNNFINSYLTDISPSNLRFVIPTLSCWTEHDILGRIGKPEPIAVPPNFVYGANNDRNTPSYLVPPAQLSRLWPHCIDDNDGTSLRICGFDKSIFTPNSKTARSLYKRMVKAQKKAGGEAGIPPGSSRSSKATPPERDPQLDKELGIISVPPPPELLLLSSEHERELGSGANPLIALGRADAPAADVFSLGCTLYSILSAEPLFPQAHILPRPTQPMTPPESPAMSRTSPTPLDLLLITMVRTLGRPPETNYRQWPGRTRYFTDAQDGSTEEADGVARATSLDGRLDELVTTDGQDRRVGLGPGEVAEFGRMLKMMVNWFPQERCTVTQAVRMLPRSWVLDGQ